MIQDSAACKLLDELDIPRGAERAELFEVLDADGSGTLSAAEFISGLMKVRGEARKSDIIATRLSVSSLQELLRNIPPLLDALLSLAPQEPHVKSPRESRAS